MTKDERGFDSHLLRYSKLKDEKMNYLRKYSEILGGWVYYTPREVLETEMESSKVMSNPPFEKIKRLKN